METVNPELSDEAASDDAGVTEEAPVYRGDKDTSNSDEVLVKVDQVSMRFCRHLKRSLLYGVMDIASEFLPIGWRQPACDSSPEPKRAGRNENLRRDEFWAVNGVSFELHRGECLGLIGHNGAGKTTLLKMLNGLIKPHSGTIAINGRVGALIALGAGFNPILTGRENVYINGAVLGLSRAEINQKFDDILEFSEIGGFIDSPVRNYSSGMRVRLGFAVATALTPDILLVDEVLAVGDFSFRQKCLKRIAKFRESGGSIILVSHNMNQLQAVCTSALYLERGAVRFRGSVSEAANMYFEDTINADMAKHVPKEPKNGKHEKTRIEDIRVESIEGGDALSTEDARFTARVQSESAIDAVNLVVVIMDREQVFRLATISTAVAGISYAIKAGVNELSFTVKSLPLAPGAYAVRAILRLARNEVPLCRIGFEDSAKYFKVTLGDFTQLNVSNQFGDLMLLEIGE